jgi:hypothetical protein
MDIDNIVNKYYGSSNFGRDQWAFWVTIADYAYKLKKD